MFIKSKTKILLFILFFTTVLSQNTFGQDNYQQLAGVTDIRTTYSDGCHSLNELARMAIQRNIDAIIVADHDIYSLEYGFFPFRNLLKYKISGPSILSSGTKKYLLDFEKIEKKYPNLIAIPAVESTPFYYWTGNFSDLNAHKWENHIMVVGMNKPSQLKGLPALNSELSTRYFLKLFPGIIPFLMSAVLGALLLFSKGYLKKIGVLIIVLNIILIINYHPLKNSLFDQYHGDQGVAPWQETINYADEIGAMTFWSRLESSTKFRKKGPININTHPHPEDLIQTDGYTGFQAIYNGEVHVTDPGHEWDATLKQYIENKRKNPPWGIGGNNFHCEGEGGKKLTDVMTIFLVKERTKEAVLHAMKSGKMYALKRTKNFRLSLDEFYVSDQLSKKRSVSGEEILLNNNPTIFLKISTLPEKNEDIKISLIRSGKQIKTFQGQTPLKISYEDNYFREGEKIYYRLKVRSSSSRDYIIANPIFVQFSGNKAVKNGIAGFVVMKEWGYLRAEPSIDAKKLGFAETNEKLEFIETTGEKYQGKPWYSVTTKKGEKAFVWSGVVKTVKGNKVKPSLVSIKTSLNKLTGEQNPCSKTKTTSANREKPEKPTMQKMEYDEALSLFEDKQYNRAIEKFIEFLNKYPDDKLAADIQYWLGECYYAKNNFKLAAKYFYKVIFDHSNSDGVKKATLKRGFAMKKLNNRDTAGRMFESVIENFPFTKEAEIAKIELRKLAREERELS